MAGVIEELIEEETRELTNDMAKKLIADGGLAIEEISSICNLPIEKVRELAAEKANQTLE